MKELERVSIESNDASVKVVEEALEEAFGGTVKELISSLLKKKRDLKKDDATRKPEVFQEMLEGVLGAGGKVIESMVVQKITYKKVELKENVRHG